jgi:iron(III) transport system substrate-binding protein
LLSVSQENSLQIFKECFEPMNRTRRAFLSGSAAFGAAIVAGQLDRPDSVSAQANRVVNLYSARHYDTDKAIYDSFTKKTGIKVNLLEAEADKLIERIKSEGANSPADLFITVDIARLWRAQEAGIFQPVSSKVLQSAVPSHLRDASGLWVGLSKRARVIVYNKAKVKPSQLSTYEALVDPQWKGRLISRSSASVYNQSLVASILAASGEAKTLEWVKGIVRNFARPPEGNDVSQIKAVAAGVADLTIVNTYYVARLMKSDKAEDKAVASQVGVFFPNQGNRGTHVNLSGGGVIKTAPNRDAAIKFLEHLVSKESQDQFARSNNEYPVVPGVALDTVVAGFGKFKEDKVSATAIGKNTAQAIKILNQAGWK